MKATMTALLVTLFATSVFALNYKWSDFSDVRVSYNTGGYMTLAQAEAAANMSTQDLKVGVLPDSEMKMWYPQACRNVNTAQSRQAISAYIQERGDRFGDDVLIFNVEYKVGRLFNGKAYYYATIQAQIPCLERLIDRDRR